MFPMTTEVLHRLGMAGQSRPVLGAQNQLFVPFFRLYGICSKE